MKWLNYLFHSWFEDHCMKHIESILKYNFHCIKEFIIFHLKNWRSLWNLKKNIITKKLYEYIMLFDRNTSFSFVINVNYFKKKKCWTKITSWITVNIWFFLCHKEKFSFDNNINEILIIYFHMFLVKLFIYLYF